MEIRSYADYLRSLDDEALMRLFQSRNDLISPPPSDIASLAIRAAAIPSLVRTVDSLNKWQLQVLEAASVLAEPFTEKELILHTDKAAKFVISTLVDRALLYTGADGYRLPSNLREVLGNEIAGLGPRSEKKLNLKELAKAPAASQKVLDAMVWGPPRGAVADVKKPNPGLKWLMDQGYVSPVNQQTVTLHREVALSLRGNKVHRELQIEEPTLEGRKVDERALVDTAVSNVTTFLRWVEEVLDYWGDEPPVALKSGGVGVRDLKELTAHLGVDTACASFIIEIAYLSGLVTIDPDDRILPTHQFDIWITQAASVKWELLASSWLITSRMSGLDAAPMGPELDRSISATLRKKVLHLLLENSSLSPQRASFIDLIKWHLPYRRTGGVSTEYIDWIIREAEWLGVTAQGALSPYGAALLQGEDLTRIDSDLPKSVDHILIQSDNTAIAPGPLEHEVAQELDLIADIESRGAATVFRFSESSLRRGLDHGRTGDEILAFLKKTSKTPIPQPLEYLIADISKKHGRLRVGSATTFIRCEDSALITQILKDKKVEPLALRRIAPEVLITTLDADDAIDILRDAGYLPAAENAQGLLLNRRRIHRAKGKSRPPRIIGEFEEPDGDLLQVAVRAVRTGEKSSAKQSTLRGMSREALDSLPRTTANETLEILSEHIRNNPNKSLSIGYADNNGLVSHRIIDPLKISAGSLMARDHATGEVLTFRIPRITGVASL